MGGSFIAYMLVGLVTCVGVPNGCLAPMAVLYSTEEVCELQLKETDGYGFECIKVEVKEVK